MSIFRMMPKSLSYWQNIFAQEVIITVINFNKVKKDLITSLDFIQTWNNESKKISLSSQSQIAKYVELILNIFFFCDISVTSGIEMIKISCCKQWLPNIFAEVFFNILCIFLNACWTSLMAIMFGNWIFNISEKSASLVGGHICIDRQKYIKTAYMLVVEVCEKPK